jgi:hypothetical protein
MFTIGAHARKLQKLAIHMRDCALYPQAQTTVLLHEVCNNNVAVAVSEAHSTYVELLNALNKDEFVIARVTS